MVDEAEPAGLTKRLVDSLYVEAMVLADEARAYFDSCGREDRLALDPMLRVGFSCEALKVTTRLMQVIAWLLTQRAVAAGELSTGDAASPERRLGEGPQSDEELLERLPEPAIALIRSSQELYERVGRVGEGVVAPEPQPSPARSLLSRLHRSL